MHIGNDIIDLQVDRSNDERFAKRTLTSQEFVWVAERQHNFPVICYFGVKEAFYKMQKQQDSSYALLPRNITVDFESHVIIDQDLASPFQWHNDSHLFYCWTIPDGPSSVINAVSLLPVPHGDPEEESQTVRILAKCILKAACGVEEELVDFTRGEGGEPLLWVDGHQFECGLSFTHHGRYAAVAMALPESFSPRQEKQILAELAGMTVFANVSSLASSHLH